MTQNPTSTTTASPPQPTSQADSSGSGNSANQMKHEAKSVAQDAAKGASDKASSLQDKAHEQGERLKRKASEVQDEAARRTREARSYVTNKARAEANKRQSKIAAGLQDAADAARSASETLKQKDDSVVAGYVDSAASKIDSVASYLRDADPGDVLDDGREMARRYPEFFFGGMFIVGLAAARFLKSSESRRDTQAGRPHSSNIRPGRASASTSGTPSRQLSQPSAAGYTTRPTGTTTTAGPGTSRTSSSL